MSPILLLLGLVALLAIGAAAFFASQLSASKAQVNELQSAKDTLSTQLSEATTQVAAFKQRVAGITNLDAEKAKVQADIDALRAAGQKAQTAIQAGKARGENELRDLQTRIHQYQAEFDALEERANLQSFGFYAPRYEFATSPAYAARLEAVRGAQKQMVKEKTAATCAIKWQVNGSEKEGQKQIDPKGLPGN